MTFVRWRCNRKKVLYLSMLSSLSASCPLLSLPPCSQLPQMHYNTTRQSKLENSTLPSQNWKSQALLVKSKGLETPAGTRVRVWRVGVRVWNVWAHINPYPWPRVRVYPHYYWQVSPVMFVGICHITTMLSTNKCFLSQWPPSSWPAVSPPSPTTTTSGNHHSTTPHHHRMMTVWQCHVTAPYAHRFRQPGMSMDMPHCLDGDDTCCPHVTQGEQPDIPPPPLYSHEKQVPHCQWRCTNNRQRMMNYGKLGGPSHCLPFSLADDRTTMWDNKATIISPPTTMTTSQLLLPCQSTYALHTWGITLPMTLGCTLHGFLTCETPCIPLPIPTDYLGPCQGCGFLAGTGIDHRKVTWGLPVPITRHCVIKMCTELSWGRRTKEDILLMKVAMDGCSWREKIACQ